MFLRGKCPAKDVPGYMIAQVASAVVAARLVLFLKDSPKVEAIKPDVIKSLVAEFLFTFALCYVVLNVATSKNTAGNSNYGLAIGFTVMAGAFAVGDISGGVFNPAVAVGLIMMGKVAVANIWVYLVANFAAAAAAATVFKLINPNDK